MIQHLVMWSFREDLQGAAREEAAEKMKKDLEALVGIVPGLISAKVLTEVLPSSTCDIALLTTLESQEALKGYAIHPEHLKVADFIKAVTCNRAALDY